MGGGITGGYLRRGLRWSRRVRRNWGLRGGVMVGMTRPPSPSESHKSAEVEIRGTGGIGAANVRGLAMPVDVEVVEGIVGR